MKLNFNSIISRTLAILLLSSTLYILFITIGTHKILGNTYKDLVNEKISIIQENIAPSLSLNLSYGFRDSILEIGEKTLQNKDVLLLQIESKSLKEKFVFSKDQKTLDSYNSSEEFISKSHLIDPTTGSKIGVMTLVYSKESYEEFMQKFYLWFFLGIFGLILSILALAYFLYSSLRPLSSLASSLANFNPNQPQKLKVYAKLKDEISSIETSANIMIENLIKYIDATRELNMQISQKQVHLLELNKTLEEASKAKSQFLANMSHEIRTPMNAIIGLSELMRDTPLNQKQLDFLTKIHGASRMLLGIINDILDFSKLEAGRLELEYCEFAVESIFAQLRVLFSTKSETKDLELYFYKKNDLPSFVKGDELRIEQVLTNLLSNALKFTHEGVVLLKIELKEKISKQRALLGFSVQDSGIGMSQEEQDKLFQPFSQADSSTTRKYGGTGLGLMISSKIVEAMGSKIEVQSEPNVGSNFSFELAMDVTSWENTTPVIEEKVYKILIVDDQEISREILKDMLEGFGCQSDEACDGLEAIEMLLHSDQQHQPYDFILLDWMMPNLDGKATIQKLQEMYQKKQLQHQIPCIMMVSAHSEEEIQLDEITIQSFLAKPVTSSTLFDALVSSDKGIIKKSPPKEQESLIDLSGAHILLVEDNEINQEVATMMLERVGARVSIANNGAEGVELFLKNPQSYCAILMDLQMPVMGGYEATKRIREHDTKIPIIALTAAAMVEDRQRVLDAGMNEHLAKPIDTNELYAKLLPFCKAQEDAPLEVLDFAFLECSLSSQDLINRLLKKFLAQLHGEFSGLIQSIQQEQKDAPARVHALKGVSGNLGAKQVAYHTKEIDAKYKAGSKPTPLQIQALEDSLKALKEKLSSLALDVKQNSFTQQLSEEEFLLFLEKMWKKLHASEIITHKEKEKLLSLLQEHLETKEYEILQEALDEFEFELALEILYKSKFGDHFRVE